MGDKTISIITNRLIYSKGFKYLQFIVSTVIVFFLFYYIQTNVNLDFANLVLSTLATAISAVAITAIELDKKVNFTEKSLYHFYYPLDDYLQGYIIQGMIQDKKDVEQIAHYRRLAKSDTREEFEKYRNSNYKKENSKQLSALVKRDITEYEQKLKI